MTVHCPHCSTGYLLPDHLVGPNGARVGCPNCRGAFVVLHGRRGADARELEAGSVTAVILPDRRAGGSAAVTGTVAATSDPAPLSEPAPTVPEAPLDGTAIAAATLDALVLRLGDALPDARRRGTVLSEHGAAIMEAWVEYRRVTGAASADPFLTALRDRFGVDLVARHET